MKLSSAFSLYIIMKEPNSVVNQNLNSLLRLDIVWGERLSFLVAEVVLASFIMVFLRRCMNMICFRGSLWEHQWDHVLRRSFV